MRNKYNPAFYFALVILFVGCFVTKIGDSVCDSFKEAFDIIKAKFDTKEEDKCQDKSQE